MRRRPGALLPLETAIIAAGIRLQRDGTREFHGFAMAKQLATHGDSRKLTAHGTLYKALDRLETAGLLESNWEDPAKAAADGRPRRRLYRVTAAGAVALANALADQPSRVAANPRLASP
jgi:PadR family transcriptional regulator PadR